MGRSKRSRPSGRYTPPQPRRGSLRPVPGVFLDGAPIVVSVEFCDDPACSEGHR